MSVPDRVMPSGWGALRRYTRARIALGRAGHSLPTREHLAFQLAHAQARDAVHLPFDRDAVAAAIEAGGQPTLALHSAAASRAVYLQRPDLGRRLDAASRERLRLHAAAGAGRVDLALLVCDGLSALAVQAHAPALVGALARRLAADARPWRLAPVALAAQGRVALGDEVGELLQADAVVVLIGERPGLSSPDSLGLYLTWAPRVGLTDAARNCISNVRPEGLAVEAAAAKLHWLLGEARRRRESGVALKDETDDGAPALDASRAGFLLAAPDDPPNPNPNPNAKGSDR